MAIYIGRRQFLATLGGAAAVWPVAVRAQQQERMRRIGVLMGYAESGSSGQALIAAFRDGLQKLGWTEGRNTRIDIRWATPSDTESIQQFAKELVALQPDLIISSTTPITAALLQQTRTIPIIFPALSDPVGSGFVASFSRPGGNVTGFNVSEPTQTGKWVELLKEIAPRVARVAMLFNPASAPYAEYWLDPFKSAATSFAVEAISAPVRDGSELNSVIAAQAREPNSGLIAMPDSFTIAFPMESTWLTIIDVCLPMSIAYSKARSRANFPSRLQSSSSWSSTSRLPERSGSTCRRRFSPAPTRRSNKSIDATSSIALVRARAQFPRAHQRSFA